MPRRTKKPWNAGKVLFPELEDPTYKHEIKPLPAMPVSSSSSAVS